MNSIGAGGAVAAAAAAAAQAIKVSGAIVKVEPGEFRKLLDQNADGLIVHTVSGILSQKHRYLMGYKGLVFHTSSSDPITVPRQCQVVEAAKIWVP
jgi:shikimate 5-dehydrogenase